MTSEEQSLRDKITELQWSVARRRVEYAKECSNLLSETLKMEEQILFNTKFKVESAPAYKVSPPNPLLTEPIDDNLPFEMIEKLEEKLKKVNSVLDQIERCKDCNVCRPLNNPLPDLHIRD